MKSKGVDNDDDTDAATTTNNNEEGIDANNPPIDLTDEELIDVMEQFALMSDEEMEEAFSEVMKMLGGDEADPELEGALREVINEVKAMDESTLIESMTNQQIAEITDFALEMISQSDWELIHDKRNEILESLIASGKITEVEATVYRSDEKEWEKELRSIWDGLQEQAMTSGSASVGEL